MLHFRQLGVKIIRAMYLGFVYEFCQVCHYVTALRFMRPGDTLSIP